MITFILSVVLAASSFAQKRDPLLDQQWYLKNQGISQVVDLDPVRNYKTPGVKGQDINLVRNPVLSPRQILVAVLDTGIDRSHADLKDMIRTKPKECAALAEYLKCKQDKDDATCDKIWMDPKNPEADTDGNGYPMDCYGWSAMGNKNEVNGIYGSPMIIDSIGHGTHVAGLIGAQVGNGVGIEGVSANVKILPVQIVSDSVSEPLKPMSVNLSPNETEREKAGFKLAQEVSDRVARGFIYALNEGAEVINMSVGWPQVADSKLLRELVAEAVKRGVIVVAAAGNDATRALLRPCSYEGVLCVGALSPDGGLAHFSNYGSGVDIAAPGLNILSTYPEDMRPARFRSYTGYEFLSGTSQASPIVAGIAAEMLARGIPSREIYSRLVHSARPVQANKTMYETFASGEKKVLRAAIDPLEKFVFSGQVDLGKALTTPFRALIAPASKERPEILWDGESTAFSLDVPMVNRGASIASGDVQIKAFIKSEDKNKAARPVVTGIQAVPVAQKNLWEQGEKRNFRVNMVLDKNRAQELPADLELVMQVVYSNGFTQAAVVEPEVTIPLSRINKKDKISWEISNLPKGRWDWTPLESVDGAQRGQVYLITEQTPRGFQVAALTIHGNKTELKGPVIIPRTQGVNLMAVMWGAVTPDGYVFGVLEEGREEDTEPAPTHFFDMDFNLNIKARAQYSPKTVRVPFAVRWLKLKDQVWRPAWIGAGLEPNRKQNLWDRWENRNVTEKVQQRLYWLDESFKPQALADVEKKKFVDFVPGPQDKEGILTALTVKSQGSTSQPSYIQDVAFVTFAEGKVQKVMSSQNEIYRSLLEAKRGPLFNLDSNTPFARGMFFFAEGGLQSQKITTWDLFTENFRNYDARAMRAHFDSALWTQAVYEGQNTSGAFVVTNSEVQYHDLRTGRAVRKSLERYSFFSDSLQILLAYPLVIQSKKGPSKLIPALFASENVDFERGVKLVVPIFAISGGAAGEVQELVSPGVLNIKADKGCKPFKTPIQLETGETALDFYCSVTTDEGQNPSSTKEELTRIYLRY